MLGSRRTLVFAGLVNGHCRRKFSSFKGIPASVRIVEVGPRDGLQNEKGRISADVKIRFIDKLSNTGLKTIEATSFVSPKYVPQMADSSLVMAGITRRKGVSYPVLTPNYRGFERALQSNCEEVSIFIAASETFSQKNTNCSIQESLDRLLPVFKGAKQHNIRVRGYISCVVGCPYEGYVDPTKVRKIAEFCLENGCYEVSLGDTIGIGTPGSVNKLLDNVKEKIPIEKIAMHLHDTYGQGLANVLTSLQHGISVFDSSCAGLGGCPFARGATGNIATEDLVYMLHGLGVDTGVDLEELVLVGDWISDCLGRSTQSRAGKALKNTTLRIL